jgi:hypothetical protein
MMHLLLTCSMEQSPSEKLTDFQLVKKLPAFYRTWGAVPSSQVPTNWASSIQSVPTHLISWTCMLTLSSHLCLGLPRGFFPLRFPHQNPVYSSPLSHMCNTPCPSHFSRFYLPSNIIIKLLIKLLCIFSAQLT